MSSTLQGGTYDEESNLVLQPSSSFDDESVRKGFIRKVYVILIAMLTLTFSVTIAFTAIPALRSWGHTLPALIVLLCLWITGIVLVIVLICNESLRRSHPQNLVFLFVITLVFAFALGITASYTKPFVVLVAIGITLTITIALTLFALQTKFDFTLFIGILFCASISLLILAILLIFVRGRILLIIFGTLGAFIVSCYIVVDTQMMMSG